MSNIEDNPNNILTTDQATNDLYSGRTEAKEYFDMGISEKYNDPVNVQNMATGKYPNPQPSALPKGKTFDTKAYIKAQKDLDDAKVMSNQDKNSWATVYSYNPSSSGNTFYEKYKDIQVYGKKEFHPLQNNEAWYNTETNFLGDVKRTIMHSAVPMILLGARDNYTSLDKLFAGENPFTPSNQSAREYAYNNARAYSSKDNLGSFVNNLLINFSYTAGLMGTALLENWVGAGISSLSGLTGMATIGRGAPKLAMQGLKVGDAVDGMSTYSNMLKEFGGDINKVRAFYNETNNIGKFQKAITSPVGKVLNPFSNITDNYYAAKASANEFSGYAQSLRSFTNTAGAAWRDFRNMNLAVSESSLEAGMVQNDMTDKIIKNFYSQHNRHPNSQEMSDITRHAKAAAYETAVMNTGLIYITNKISFDNILNPRVGTQGILRQKVIDWKSIGKGKFGKLGDIALERSSGTFKFYDKNFKTWYSRWKTDPLSKSIWGTVGYLKRNFAEGIQESLQETISAANERYYTEAYYSNAVKKNFITKAAFGKESTPLSYYGKGLQDQFSKEGFTTFASGFAMGSLAGGLNSSMDFLMTRGAQIFDPKGYEEYVKESVKIKDDLLNKMNAVSVTDFISSRLLNAGTQDVISGIQTKANKKELMDTKSEAMIEHINMLIDYGVYDMYIDNIKSYQQATVAEFEEAFPQTKGEGAKYKDKINGVVEEAKKIQDLRKFYDKKYPNPIDLTKYDESDYDYEEAVIMSDMWNRAVKTAVFYNKSWEDVKGRMIKVLDTHYSERPLEKMTKRDSDIILRVGEMKNEIGLLKNEINAIIQNPDPESKKLAKTKAEKLKALEEYADVYDVFDTYYHRNRYREAAKVQLQKGKTKDEVVTEEEIDQLLSDEFGVESDEAEQDVLLNLQKAYSNLLRKNAAQNEDYFFDDKADDGFQLVLDYYKLGDEARALVDYINLINDPNGFVDVYKRNLDWMNNLWLKRGDYYKEIIAEEFSNIEDNALLNNLAAMGIFMEGSDFIRWKDEGIPPKEFFDQKKDLVIPEGSQAYDRYMEKLHMAEGLKDLQKFANEQEDIINREARIEELVKRKKVQIAKVKEQFDEDIQIETGNTEEELRQMEDEALEGQTAADVNAQIADLNSQIKLIEESKSVEELIDLYKVYEEQGLIPANFAAIIEQVAADNNDAFKKFFKSTKNSGAPIEARQQATGIKFAMPIVLNAKIDELKALETTGETTKVEDTKSWKDYQLAIAKIEERYDRYLQKLTEGLQTPKSTTQAAPTVRKEEVEVSTSMAWDELPEDFKMQLQPLFDEYLVKTLNKPKDFDTIDPRKYAMIRQNWFETQKALVDQYNKTPVEKRSFVPELKYLTLEKPIGEYGSTNLRRYKNQIESDVDRGYRIDQVTNEKVDLTPSEKVAARADIKALDEYLNYVRTTYVPKNNADRVFRIFEEMVINKQNKVERILDENGNTTGYKFPGKEDRPMRVTKYTEEIEIKMTGKEPFMYDAIKEPYIEDGKTKGGQLLNMFRNVVNDTDIKAEERLSEFMRILEADVRSGSLQQLNSERKLEKIKQALTNNFSEESLIAVVKAVAFDESTIAGNTVDNMARLALKRNPSGEGFMVPAKPEKMSQQAYDALFGNNGIITKLQEQIIDGKYELLTDDVLIYDESLLENGIVGAMDIVAFDKTTGKFSIIDIKTGNENSWTNFTKGKLLNYRLQQTIYRNLTFNMTGELAEKLSLLPIEISVDRDGNILTAKSAANTVNKEMIRALKNDLLAAEESSRPNDSKIKELKQQITSLEASDTVALKPVDELETTYGIKMTKPELPDNLKSEKGEVKKEVIDQAEVKKKIKDTKTQITKTQKKLDGLKDGGVLYLGDVVTMSPDYDRLTASIKAFEESLTKLEAMLETPKPKAEGSDTKEQKTQKIEGTNARGTTYKGEITEKDGLKITKYSEFNSEGKRISKGGRIMTPAEFIKEYNITDQEYLDNLKGATEIRIYEVREKDGILGISIQRTTPEGKAEMNVAGAELNVSGKLPTLTDLDAEILALKLMKDGVQVSNTGAPTMISAEQFDKYIDDIVNSRTLDDLEKAYTEATVLMVAEPEMTFGDIIEKAYNLKKRSLAVNVSEQNLAKGEYLLSKTPIFTENAGEIVVVMKVENGKVTVKQIGVDKPKQKTFTDAQLKDKFTKTTKEALEETKEEEPMNEEQKINSEISQTSAKDFAGSKDLIAAAKENSKKDRKSRFSALKDISKDDNINNCKK